MNDPLIWFRENGIKIAVEGTPEYAEMVQEPPVPVACCCGEPFEIDGILYSRVNAGCLVHGLRSRYIPQPGVTTRDMRRDGKKHTSTGRDDA